MRVTWEASCSSWVRLLSSCTRCLPQKSAAQQGRGPGQAVSACTCAVGSTEAVVGLLSHAHTLVYAPGLAEDTLAARLTQPGVAADAALGHHSLHQG